MFSKAPYPINKGIFFFAGEFGKIQLISRVDEKQEINCNGLTNDNWLS